MSNLLNKKIKCINFLDKIKKYGINQADALAIESIDMSILPTSIPIDFYPKTRNKCFNKQLIISLESFLSEMDGQIATIEFTGLINDIDTINRVFGGIGHTDVIDESTRTIINDHKKGVVYKYIQDNHFTQNDVTKITLLYDSDSLILELHAKDKVVEHKLNIDSNNFVVTTVIMERSNSAGLSDIDIGDIEAAIELLKNPRFMSCLFEYNFKHIINDKTLERAALSREIGETYLGLINDSLFIGGHAKHDLYNSYLSDLENKLNLMPIIKNLKAETADITSTIDIIASSRFELINQIINGYQFDSAFKLTDEVKRIQPSIGREDADVIVGLRSLLTKLPYILPLAKLCGSFLPR